MAIVYLDHLPEHLIDEAVELYLQILGDKLIPILGNDQRVRHLLQSDLAYKKCLATIDDGYLVGLLVSQTARGRLFNATFRDLLHIYGMAGGFWRMGALALLDPAVRPGEIYIEGLMVAKANRGQGIGTQLIDRLMQWALKRGAWRLTLEVIDTNPRAHRLYRRLGFRGDKSRSLWPLNRLFKWSFKAAILMYKPIGRSRPNQNPADPNPD
jgi:GNAT superfamily N-acetyltransferase